MLINIKNLTSEETGKVLNFLCEEGYDFETVEETDHLKSFLKEEAMFRLIELGILSDDIQEKVNNLSEEDKDSLTDLITDKYFKKEIFDYDYMDSLLMDEVDEFLKDK